MYFEDLSQYAYGRTPTRPHILNVGWLSQEHAYPRGTAPDWLLPRLEQLVKSPVNLYRGFHLCEICPKPPTIMSPGGVKMLNPPPETKGNGEIRVRAGNGTIYVAPVLIYHHVAAHGYLPPEEFISAVQTGVAIVSDEESL